MSLRGPGSEDYNVNLLGLLRGWAMRWKVIVALPGVVAVTAVLLSFLVTPRYRARIRFVPEDRGGTALPAGLAGLASQFGVNVGANTEASKSPEFYADLAESPPVLRAVLTAKYATPGSPADSAALIDLLNVAPEEPSALRMEEGVERLQELVTVRVDRTTNVVTVEVEATAPSIAPAVVTRIMETLSEFNLRNRQSQARSRRVFVEDRTAAAELALTSAEESLRAFYEQNRQWEAPALRAEEARLRRRVEIQQEVYVSLRRELDIARINEVNDTPVLNVIEPPMLPVRKSWPRRVRWAWVSFVLTAIGVIVGVVAYDHMGHWRRLDPEAFEWFARLLRRRAA